MTIKKVFIFSNKYTSQRFRNNVMQSVYLIIEISLSRAPEGLIAKNPPKVNTQAPKVRNKKLKTLQDHELLFGSQAVL